MSIDKSRLLLYSHDTLGLGHLRRSLAISHRLARDYPELSQLLVTGSTRAHHYALPAGLDYIKLPAIKKRGNGDYQARTLKIEFGQMLHWRAGMILQAAREFRPDMLLVDKAPGGVSGELRPTLDYLKREAPNTRLVYGMRDVIDGPAATRAEWTREGVYELLEETYDAILLYGSRTFFDPIHEYRLPPRTATKLIECGHIARAEPIRPRQEVLEEFKTHGRALLVVTAGGGSDGAALIQATLEVLDRESQNGSARFHALVVTGPFIPRWDYARLQDLARRIPAVKLVEFTDDLPSYINAADVVVTMGGYNTVCELLTLKQRAVIVPRVNVRTEQLIRAERLAERGLARVIHPAQLTPARLLEEIGLALAAPRPDPERRGMDLRGLDRVSIALGHLLSTSWSDTGSVPLSLPRVSAKL